MMYLVLLVLNDLEPLDAVMEAWSTAGVGGITLLPSTGYQKLVDSHLREDMPLIPSLNDFLQGHEEVASQTLMTVVPSETLVDRLFDITQEITGNLDDPNTGIMVALPVYRGAGIHDRRLK